MSATPEIGGNRPIRVQRRGRQELLVVRLRALEEAAVLRRLAQGHGVLAARVQGGEIRGGLVLRLQAHRQAADVRRQPQEADVMPDLLLEFFSEEIPARMQARAAEDLKKLVTDKLVEAGLTYEGATAFATPRRLALAVAGIPVRQPDVKEERKGPRVDANEKAIAGFLQGRGARVGRAGQDREGPEEGRLLRRGDREGRAARDRGDRRDRAGRGEVVSVAEGDALGRGVGASRRAQLGAAAAFHRRDVRAGDRRARGRDVRRRRHRGGRHHARPSLPRARRRSR